MNYKSMYLGDYSWFQIEVNSQFWYLSHCFTSNKECMLLEKDQHNQQWYQDNFLITLYGVPADCAMQWNELSPLCHVEHSVWFTMPIFIPLWTLD